MAGELPARIPRQPPITRFIPSLVSSTTFARPKHIHTAHPPRRTPAIDTSKQFWHGQKRDPKQRSENLRAASCRYGNHRPPPGPAQACCPGVRAPHRDSALRHPRSNSRKPHGDRHRMPHPGKPHWTMPSEAQRHGCRTSAPRRCPGQVAVEPDRRPAPL